MKLLRVFLFIFITAVFGYGVYHSLFKTELTTIKEIKVTGAQPETEKRLLSLLKTPKGSSFWKVDVNSIALTVKADSWVEDAEIKKNFPDKIVIKILERTPEAVLNKGANRFAYIDAKNHVFGPAHPAEISNHIIFSGKTLNEDAKARELALQMLKLFPKEGPLNQNDVSEIQFTSEKGFEIILSKTGIKVELGKENTPLHLDRARRVVQYLDQHQINATHIDADYAKKVLVKVRKDR